MVPDFLAGYIEYKVVVSDSPDFSVAKKSDNFKVRGPDISLEKTASPTHAKAGDKITYTYKITNSGYVNFSDVTLKDDPLFPEGITLDRSIIPAPGKYIEVTQDYFVDADDFTGVDSQTLKKTLTNYAEVKGKYGKKDDEFVTAKDEATVTLDEQVLPSIQFKKNIETNDVTIKNPEFTFKLFSDNDHEVGSSTIGADTMTIDSLTSNVPVIKSINWTDTNFTIPSDGIDLTMQEINGGTAYWEYAPETYTVRIVPTESTDSTSSIGYTITYKDAVSGNPVEGIPVFTNTYNFTGGGEEPGLPTIQFKKNIETNDVTIKNPEFTFKLFSDNDHEVGSSTIGADTMTIDSLTSNVPVIKSINWTDTNFTIPSDGIDLTMQEINGGTAYWGYAPEKYTVRIVPTESTDSTSSIGYTITYKDAVSGNPVEGIPVFTNTYNFTGGGEEPGLPTIQFKKNIETNDVTIKNPEFTFKLFSDNDHEVGSSTIGADTMTIDSLTSNVPVIKSINWTDTNFTIPSDGIDLTMQEINGGTAYWEYAPEKYTVRIVPTESTDSTSSIGYTITYKDAVSGNSVEGIPVFTNTYNFTGGGEEPAFSYNSV